MPLKRHEIIFLMVIALVTVVLRLPTITFGVSAFEGADDAYVLRPALEIGSLIKLPTEFGLPDSTLFYGYGVVFRVVFEVLQFFGVTQGVHPLDDYSAYHATWPLITVRVLNILWTLLTLLLVYLCSKKLFSVKAAAAAVVLAASSWMLLEHTIHVRPDLLSAALALAVLYVSINIMLQGRQRDFIIAGVLVGIAVATKYPLVLTALIVMTAHGIHSVSNGKRGIQQFLFAKPLWIAGGIALLTFSVATPLFWPHVSDAVAQIRYEARTVHPGADGLSFFGNLHFYLTHVLHYGIGTLAAIVALIGAVLLVVKQRRVALLVLIFPVALVLVLSTHGLHWDRWLIPVIPFLAMLAGYAIAAVFNIRFVANARYGGVICGTLLIILVLVPAIVRTVRSFNSFQHEETREIAKNWFVENAFPNARIAREAYTPLLSPHFEELYLTSLGSQSGDQLAAQQIDYLISNVEQRNRFLTHPNTFPVFIEYYHAHLKHAELVFTARTDSDRNAELLVPISDWDVWKHIAILDVRRGAPIEIYAFSPAAKQWHASSY